MKTKITIMAQLSLSALLISAANSTAQDDYKAAQLKEEQVEVRSEMTSIRASRVNATNHTLQQSKNLRLRADITDSLEVADKQINWTVSQNDEVITQLQGNLQNISLPTGSYAVELNVGKYRNKKQINIHQGQQIQPYFGAEMAELQLRSNQVVDWLITSTDNHSYRVNGKSNLNELLPAGNYTVRASFGDFSSHKKVYISPGQQLKTTIDIPIGTVRLMATKNGQPLFKSVAWDIYRLTKGQRKLVGKYDLHSRSISMPPGHYEAIARHKNIRGNRQFRVREGSTNNVIVSIGLKS